MRNERLLLCTVLNRFCDWYHRAFGLINLLCLLVLTLLTIWYILHVATSGRQSSLQSLSAITAYIATVAGIVFWFLRGSRALKDSLRFWKASLTTELILYMAFFVLFYFSNN